MAVIGAMVSGCSTPIALRAPVGPDPFIGVKNGPCGSLRVFTETEIENNVGFEFPYYQRTDYDVYDSTGRRIKHVSDNNLGHFEAVPRTIQLAPGVYRIKAMAAVGLGELITVPVVVESGRTTEAHLNGHWQPPANTPESQLVRAPAGFAVGWRVAGRPNG